MAGVNRHGTSTADPGSAPPVWHPPGRLVAVNGRGLWVEEDGTGEPLLFLTGLGPAGSHVLFHPHVDRFDGYHSIFVDLYGRGRSDAPRALTDITFVGDVADIVALTETLRVGPVHLYGFSYGGLVCQALALDRPDLVRTLTLANTLHSPRMWQLNHENINHEISRQLPDVWSRILELRQAGVPSTDARMQALFASAAPLVRFYNPDNARLLATEAGARNVELYRVFCGDDVDFAIGGQIPKIPDFLPLLAELQVPAQVLAGRFDRALYPGLQLEFAQAAPQLAVHFLDRSGSFSHVEQPDEVYRLIRALTRSRSWPGQSFADA